MNGVRRVNTTVSSETREYLACCTPWALRYLLITNCSTRRFEDAVDDGVLGEMLGLRGFNVEKPASTMDDASAPRMSRKNFRMLLRSRLKQLERKPPARKISLFKNIARLTERLALTSAAQTLLAFAVLLESIPMLKRSIESTSYRVGNQEFLPAIAEVLDLPPNDVRDALAGTGVLTEAGLLTLNHNLESFEDKLRLRDKLAPILLTPHEDVESLLQHFFRTAVPSNLDLSDFPHLERDYTIIKDYLASALRNKIGGVNILMHGTAGTGKTELVRALGVALKAIVYEVNSADDNGDSINGSARFASYQLCQKLLRASTNSLVMFDEIEDVFPSSESGSMRISIAYDSGRGKSNGKAWINRLLETNPIPAIWVSNRIDQIDAAYLRRFDYVIEFPEPPKTVRLAIARRHLGDLPVSETWLDRMADYPELTPAQFHKTARILRATENDDVSQNEAIATRVLENSMRTLNQSRNPQRSSMQAGYSLEFINVKADLPGLIAGLKARRRGAFCFYGPPGTGKSEFARHIARSIDAPIVFKQASSLLSMWVGGTEQLIAHMFREATDQNAVLVLDEADSFLQDRRGAVRSWEITQVNEMLTQMEHFEGIFICTTNLISALDQASLRRFSFKIEFDYLYREQRLKLFAQELRRLNSEAAEPDGLATNTVARLENLTPGDFAAAARRFQIMNIAPDANALATALEDECGLKESAGQSIGFV